MTRQRLPDRRPALSVKLTLGSCKVHATAGFDPTTGQVREVFLRPRGPSGSDMDNLLDDVAVLLSHLLQLGVEPAALAAALGRLGGYTRVLDAVAVQPDVWAVPASMVGEVVDWLAGLAVQIADDAILEPWERGTMKDSPDLARIRAEQAARDADPGPPHFNKHLNAAAARGLILRTELSTRSTDIDFGDEDFEPGGTD